jgi:hypothetical protein
MGQRSIDALWNQLLGIYFAEDFHNIPEESRFGGFDLISFEAWVDRSFNADRLSVRSFGLSKLIAGSDAKGFDLWFEWYDRYRSEHPAVPPGPA